MNHIYKVIWNTITQTWVAVSELSRAKGKTKSSKTLSAVVLAAVSAGAIVGDAEAARSSIPPGEVIGNGMAIGTNSYANKNSVAYGVAAKANDGYAVAIGANAVTERVAAGSVGVANSRGQIAIGSNSYAKKEGDTAIGSNAKAEGQFSTAVGNGAQALGNNSSAFGEGAQAKADYSTALGKGAEAKEMYSIALGKESHAEKSFSTSVGFKTEAKGLSSLALGSGVVPSKDLTGDGRVDEDDIALNRTIADGNAAFAAGASANATGSYASALGGESKATANAALAVGKMANASDQSTIAVGDNAQASGAKATSIGAGAIAKNEGTIAIGDRAKVGATNGNVAANNGIAIGTESESKNEQAIAVGKKAIAAGNNSIALGNETTTTGGEGVAIGNTASASHHSVAFGSQAKATATDGYSSAFGNESEANKADSSALGNTAKALAKNATSVGAHSKVTETAENGSALGRSANVSATNGTALGSSSSVTAANGTAVGTSATVTTAGGVALGQGSLSGRGALDKNKVKITAGHVEDSEGISQNDDKNNKNGDVYAPVKLIDKAEVLERVKNTILGSAGAVSLGKDGETTRQLTNLAPGSADSDAVNVAQLKAVVGTIKHYNVTSKDGDITVSPDTTDPNKTVWDLKINPKYKIKYFSVKSEGGANENNDGATGADAIAIGKDTIAKKANAIAIGHEAKAQGYQNDIAIGYKAATNSEKSIAIGDNAKTDAGYSIALGTNATATVKNGIALGSESKASINNGQTGFDASQDADGARVNKYNNLTNNNQNVRTSTLAGLSIGDAAKTRQINHLAAGTADDDAVNVAQLKSVNLAFKGDNNTKGDVRLHDQRLSVVGATDSFITTKASNNKLEISTTKGTFSTTDGKSSSATSGLATTTAVADAINASGWKISEDGTSKGIVNPGNEVSFKGGDGTEVTVSDADGNGKRTVTIASTVKPNAKGVIEEVTTTTTGNNAKKKGQVQAHDGDGDKVTTVGNVANMINSAKWFAKASNTTDEVTDANKTDDANDADGQAMSAGDKLTLKAGKNLRVKRDGANFTFALNNTVDLTNAGSLTIGNTKVNNDGVTITAKEAGKTNVTLTANGLDNGKNKIVNVAEGTKDTDAVNVKQLNDSISTESVAKAADAAGDKNIADVTVADNKAEGAKGAKYLVSVSEKAVKQAAHAAIDVKGTNFISATSKVDGDVETHTVTATTNAVDMNAATGAANTTEATGLTTNKAVADAINASGWKISEDGTSKGIVNPG
ncbi:ESPR-type extended signal peptide-containing protein, partial [Haemophilus haemolyticus]|uniref:ESPR-type extended signal peptide-containing protein n=1 Tax=Haemophilus haemolyticus TaxID=726 RepID=UPI00195B90C2